MTNEQELRTELDEVETSLASAQQTLDELRDQRQDPDALPDTSDDAVLIRELEDAAQIVEQLEARRTSLREQLG